MQTRAARFVAVLVLSLGAGGCGSSSSSSPASETDAGAESSEDTGGESNDAAEENPIEGGSDATGDAGACSALHAESPACEACQNERCCLTATTCAADPECVALQDCINNGSPCPGAHPAGEWNFSGVEICRQNSCSSECGTAPPKCGNIVPDPASCLSEVQSKCCTETAACGANESCVALIYQCLDQNNCSNATCLAECKAKYPAGADLFDAMAACWTTVSCL